MDQFQDFLNNKYLLSTTLSFAAFFSLFSVKKIIISKLRKIVLKTETQLDDMVLILAERTSLIFLFFFSLYLGFYRIQFSKSMENIADKFMVVAVVFQLGIWGSYLVSFAIQNYFESKTSPDGSEKATINFISFLAKIILYTTLLLLGMHNLGVDITALVTGLGVGGIAIALAVQNILGDLFASMTIVLDKPFVVGDFISVDSLSGHVEYVGLKTTRLKALNGEQLIFSNADLLRSRIQNFKRMNERRVLFTIGLTYQTPKEKIEKVPGMIKSIIEKIPQARFERSFFMNFGASSLDVETVYWVLDREIETQRETQQKINLALMSIFEQEKIDFAYPTQTLFIQKS